MEGDRESDEPEAAFSQRLDAARSATHVLNRLTYGARPGDAERLQHAGLQSWIEAQLHPEQVPEDPTLEEKLRPLNSLRMSDSEIAAHYPSPQYIRAVARGQLPLPSDPELAKIVERLAQRFQARQQGSDERAGLESVLSPAEIRAFRQASPEERVALLMRMEPDKLSDLLFVLPRKMRRAMFAYAPVELRRRMLLTMNPQQVVVSDLLEGKIYRALYSNRQLEEVLTDFWFNHFNVFLNKGPVKQWTTTYEREAIRPYVLGRFGDMLTATAQHPAMLFYLDNWQSVDPTAAERIRERRPNALSRMRGLNENYARELLELHTLGVDGGFTQQDVNEIARCFTGWSIEDPRRGGGFRFNWALHDRREKEVLGQRFGPGGGIDDGLEVIDILVEHPSTARFISTKLAQRFVADSPPESLIRQMAERFQQSGGDLREVMRVLLGSTEFLSEGAYRSKVKSPLELVTSASRAIGGQVDFAFGLGVVIEEMGQPLYATEAPTGYPPASHGWWNSATLLARLNFVQALAANKVPGAKVDLSAFEREPGTLAAALGEIPLSDSTLGAIEEQFGGSSPQAAVVAGLLLGSPEFQRR